MTSTGPITRVLLAVAIAVHGLVHWLGAARGLGLADIPQLANVTISPLAGVGWLMAGGALLATAWLVAAGKAAWWMLGLPAAVLSQAMLFTAWADTRVGTVANAVMLLLAAYALAATGPWSLGSEYRRSVEERLRGLERTPPLADTDVGHLPEPVRRYLRVAGAIGRARPTHVRASWRGRIRASATDRWIAFTAEQHNFLDEPARFFRMDARRGGVPVDVLHAFERGAATMRVRVLSAFQILSAGGPDATRAETVTLLNDVCLLAPGALVRPSFRWESVDARSARVHYTLGPNTVSAMLHFDAAGDLVDFVSDDRLAASPDGKTFTRRRWSTPVSSYQTLDGVHVMRHGEGRWHPEGEPSFSYIELDLTDLSLDSPHGAAER